MNSENTKHQHHILPLSLYLNIGMTLLCLTVITVWVAQYDLGSMNLLVAMLVAATKATLVALFFMHLKYDNKLYLFIFLSSILFLAVFIIITMFDTLRRGDIDDIKSGPIDKDAVIYRDQPVDTSQVFIDSSQTVSDSILIEVDSVQ